MFFFFFILIIVRRNRSSCFRRDGAFVVVVAVVAAVTDRLVRVVVVVVVVVDIIVGVEIEMCRRRRRRFFFFDMWDLHVLVVFGGRHIVVVVAGVVLVGVVEGDKVFHQRDADTERGTRLDHLFPELVGQQLHHPVRVLPALDVLFDVGHPIGRVRRELVTFTLRCNFFQNRFDGTDDDRRLGNNDRRGRDAQGRERLTEGVQFDIHQCTLEGRHRHLFRSTTKTLWWWFTSSKT
mmetsp:Transcript_29345/g.70781  ORF Transcript_29345/g.70781 Transcript_29345/m.70781 type:complete len:235 (+) Transcript_29345:1610-2314(+)